jgi:hypothetical protein
MRARLHQRVELLLYGTFVQRLFDYFPATNPELLRTDYVFNADLSFTIKLKSWLELFFGGTVIYNASNNDLFTYLKPTAYLGLASYLGFL